MSNDTLLKEWKQLKSGTDIRGVAMSEPEERPLPSPMRLFIAWQWALPVG